MQSTVRGMLFLEEERYYFFVIKEKKGSMVEDEGMCVY